MTDYTRVRRAIQEVSYLTDAEKDNLIEMIRGV